MRLRARRVKLLLPRSLVDRLAAQAGGTDIGTLVVRAVRADLRGKTRTARGRPRMG